MTSHVTRPDARFATSVSQVTIAALVMAIALYFLSSVISTSMIQEMLGLRRQIDARVPTFLIRICCLLVAIAAAFYAVTGLSMYKRNKLAWAPWLFLAVGLGFFIVYVIAPIFQSISYSFTRWNGLYDINGDWTGEWVGLQNYRVGLIFAWAYNPEFGLLSEIWSWFFCETKENIMGNLTRVCSVEPPSILGDEDSATYGIIAAGLWPQIAYCMILYLTGLNNVSSDQIEAGQLDGAKGWKMLWHVVLPQLKPATFIAIVVTVIGALRSFDMIATMTQGGPYGSSNVLAYYMYDQAVGEGVGRYGYGSAIATVLFLIMLVYISYFLLRMYQDEKEGS